MRAHFKSLAKGIHANPRLQGKYTNHSEWNCSMWRWECVQEVHEQDLIQTEQVYLDSNYGLPLCMNCSRIAGRAPGNKGMVRTPQWRSRLSAALKGIKKSPEHCAKMSIAFRRRKLSPENIKQRGATRALTLKRVGYVNPNKGRKLSPEALTARNKKFRDTWLAKKELPVSQELPSPPPFSSSSEPKLSSR